MKYFVNGFELSAESYTQLEISICNNLDACLVTDIQYSKSRKSFDFQITDNMEQSCIEFDKLKIEKHEKI